MSLLTRVNQRFSHVATFRTRDDVLSFDEVESPSPLLVSEEMPFDRARVLYRDTKTARAELGLSPLLVTTEALQYGAERYDFDPDDTSPEAFFATRAAEYDPGGVLEEALDRLGSALDRDPLSFLHRVFADELAAFEADGEPFELDELAYPDDVREAYRLGHVYRAELLKAARARGGGMVQIQPLRTFDEATALAELDGRPMRVVLAPGTAPDALAAVGFGGFNDCPAPEVHARLWERWARLHGAEPIVVERDRLQGWLARPVDTREALLTLARELALYAPDGLGGGCLSFLGQLYRNASVSFWWD